MYIACGRIVDVQKCQSKDFLCKRLMKLKRDWAWTVDIVDMKYGRLNSCRAVRSEPDLADCTDVWLNNAQHILSSTILSSLTFLLLVSSDNKS